MKGGFPNVGARTGLSVYHPTEDLRESFSLDLA